MLKLNDYALLLKNVLNKSYSIVLGCNCRVKYSGRAESFLSEGDRTVIIKEDNTLLVHQPTGNNPVNYMKTGTTHSVVQDEDKLVLRSKNPSTKEFLDIIMYKVHFFNYLKMADGKSIELQGTEKDMAEMLMKKPDLVEPGFKPLGQEGDRVLG